MCLHLFDSKTESVPKAGAFEFQVKIQDLKESVLSLDASYLFWVYACRLCIHAEYICAFLYSVYQNCVFYVITQGSIWLFL